MKNRFIEKANLKFGSKYNYSKFNYINAKTKSIIICPIHGEFEQNPDKHLNSKFGCSKCACALKQKRSSFKIPVRITKEIMLQKLQTKFPHLYFNMKEFKTQTEGKIAIVCPIHGTTTATARSCYQSNNGCSKCGDVAIGKKNTQDVTTTLANITTKYPNIIIPDGFITKYKTTETKMTFICPTHGEFTRSSEKLLTGQTCSSCKLDKTIAEGKLPGGYCETIFSRSDALKSKPGYLYHMKVGSYHKIGITINIRHRLYAIKSLSQLQVTLIQSIKLPLYEAYQLEQQIIRKCSASKADVNWSTEVFTEDLTLYIKELTNAK